MKNLTDEQAREVLKRLAKSGVALGKLHIELEIEEAIPLHGMERGRLGIERFFWWRICKAYYRPCISFEEMHCVSFDWFRTMNCYPRSPDEIVKWCGEVGLETEHPDIQEPGITVVARRLEADLTDCADPPRRS